MKTSDREITLRLVLESPPPGVAFGIQKGRGAVYETIQTQRSTGSDLIFQFDVALKESADFGGPFVQGPRGGRFVYVDIGTLAGQRDTPWSRRLKVPLTRISSRTIERAPAGGSVVLEARVPGTARDGSPACASVKNFDGWKVSS